MILWADGFDAYGTSLAQMLDGLYAEIASCTLATSGPTPRTGSHCLLFDSSAARARRVLGGNLPVVGVAQALWLTALPGTALACALCEFQDSNNFTQIAVFCDTTGVVSVWRANGAVIADTLLGVSTVSLVASAWQHLEIKVDFPGETVEIRLNSVTILSISGQSLVNTHPDIGGPTGQVSCAQLRFINHTSNNGERAIDDLVVWDDSGTYNNDFVGDVKVFTDMPNADTADVDWTPLSGSDRYAMIDESPADGDASYDETTAAGERMGVTFPALDPSITGVAAVVYVAKTRKTDAGVCSVTVKAQSGGSEDDGASNPLTTQYTYRWDVFETDPDTSAPWDPTAAGAAAMVLERTA